MFCHRALGIGILDTLSGAQKKIKSNVIIWIIVIATVSVKYR